VFTLLHTNDFHNHLSDVQADYLHRLRAAVGTRGLLLDAGDAVASGNITYKPGGEPILKTMNTIGYDAMTVGNREFHFSRAGFHCKVGLAQFTVLCANVRLSRQSLSEPAPPELPAEESLFSSDKSNASRAGSTSTDHAGLRPDPPVSRCTVKALTDGAKTFRVVVFGLTVPMITERMTVRHASPYVFDDPLVTAARFVPQLHNAYRPDLLVVLSHIGIGQDRKLAETVPGIDLIIGGHTHDVLECGERVGDTLLVQAGSHGRFWGRVDVLPASDTSSRPQLAASLLPLPRTPDEAKTQIQSLRESFMPGFLPELISKFTSDAEKL
jgi:2',3'-cyclic-nucleotide 2'-phosphodiesterase (5'-nucleotidase family)